MTRHSNSRSTTEATLSLIIPERGYRRHSPAHVEMAPRCPSSRVPTVLRDRGGVSTERGLIMIYVLGVLLAVAAVLSFALLLLVHGGSAPGYGMCLFCFGYFVGRALERSEAAQ